MNKIILRQLDEKLKSISAEENSAVVLKGIPLSFVGDENFPEDLDAAKENRFRYFNKLVDSERKIFTYEEFLLMQTYFFDAFDSIYILNNNLFMKQYPIEDKFNDATKKILLEYFAEPENDNVDPKVQSLSEKDKKLANIFWLKEFKNFLIGVYNDDEVLSKPKVTVLNLFAPAEVELVEINLSNVTDFIDLKEESDFVDLVRKIIFDKPDKISVRTCNYSGNGEELDSRLKIICKYFSAQTKIFRVCPEKIAPAFKHRDEFNEILKRHWDYDDFRNFKAYDRQKLYGGERILRDVSQEQIISDIVEQVELRKDGKDSRDIFVTAPTGAGKSVMFQVPAIYLAKEYNLLTIVISPLIALMNDQVQNLELKNYQEAKTINSDISPILKEEIIDKVAAGECNILYVSPETLLSRSDVEQLIGDRKIGLVVIDEAHIVTTWGKEFRPDYWYLGDHIKKLRKKYPFIIATFTATAIYGGKEDMYGEIIKALHMEDPITYLGYIKRDDIDIVINKSQNKFGEISAAVDQAIKSQKNFDAANEAFEAKKNQETFKAKMKAKEDLEKLLIYFPWVKLINKAIKNLAESPIIETYHGQMYRCAKKTSYDSFKNGEALVMLATTAFGMGVDIDDIKTVMHFAPTGNVCNYVQEIGRAARKKGLNGEAIYYHDSSDFKYVKFFHRMAIKEYQLVDVAKKICEIYNGKKALMLDAENFSYIFSNSEDEEDTINKVKIALLIIQKDLEAKHSFPPIIVRPWPLYAKGFFEMTQQTCSDIQEKYGNCVAPIDIQKNIYNVNLKRIWEKTLKDKSFPNFKRMIYCKDNSLPAELRSLWPAYIANIEFRRNSSSIFQNIFGRLKATVRNIYTGKNSISLDDFINAFVAGAQGLRNSKGKTICEILIAFLKSENAINQHDDKFSFKVDCKNCLNMVEDKFMQIAAGTQNGVFYITSDKKDFDMVLGILEAMGVLTFDITGGLNNQLLIYINQIDILENIVNNKFYSNTILKDMEERYNFSLEMLKYIYEGDFTSATIWNLLEDYFLGEIPLEVRNAVALNS